MAKQSKYKVFDGTNWVDPCTTEIRLLTSLTTTNGASVPSFELLDPEVRVIKYYDGSQWVRMRCIEPECFCPEGYTKNPTTYICEKFIPAFYDGTLVPISKGSQTPDSYGQDGLVLYPPIVWDQVNKIQPVGFSFLHNGIYYNPITGTQSSNMFKQGSVWRWRLRNCGIAQYKHKVWNRKKAYTAGNIVSFQDPADFVWKKYTALVNISQNLVSPFNSSPVDDTLSWSTGTVLVYDNSNIAIGNNTNDYVDSEFLYCLNIANNKIYHIGFSGDNKCFVSLQLNSTGPFIPLTEVLDSTNFRNWFVIPIELPQGNHRLKLVGRDEGGYVSTGIEVYDMNKDNDPNINPVERFKQEFIYAPGTTSIEPLSHASDDYAKLEPYVLFTTNTMVDKAIPIPNEVDPATGQPYIPYCADGTTADYCNGAPVCPITTPCLEEPPV